MKVSELIEKLKELPQDLEVRVFDVRKNFSWDNGDGESELGIYEFDIEHCNEVDPQWVALGFCNPDYDDDGNLVD
jgi:hypothetical protein